MIMKIGVLSDVHANHLALERVLDEAESADVQRLLVLGDLVGYYYSPKEVLRQIRNWDHEVIGGNHEEMMQLARNDVGFAKKIKQKYGSGIEIALESLDSSEINFLTSLPPSRELNIGGQRIVMCHGSPWNRDTYIYPDASPQILDRFNTISADVVFMGHTHRPFVSCRGSTLLVNVGSVGQSRDKGGVASWVIFDTYNKTLVFKNTNYDVRSLVEKVKQIDPHVPYLYQVLLRC